MDRSTKEYRRLKRRIKELENNFSFKQKMSGITKKQEDLLRGFILLCHAEIEEYLEDMAIKILEKSMQRWTQRHVADFKLASLLVMLERIDKNDTTETKVNHIVSNFRKLITSNNGIKADDVKKIYEKLGYRIEDFDSVLVSSLDSFGSLRGEMAHRSSIKITNQLNKDDVFGKVDSLISQLKMFDDTVR